jgi:hypothetical protein
VLGLAKAAKQAHATTLKQRREQKKRLRKAAEY